MIASSHASDGFETDSAPFIPHSYFVCWSDLFMPCGCYCKCKYITLLVFNLAPYKAVHILYFLVHAIDGMGGGLSSLKKSRPLLINLIRLPFQLMGKLYIGKIFQPRLSSLAPVNLVSRNRFGRPVPRQPNLVLTHGIPPAFRDGRCPFTLPSTGIAPVPGLSRHEYICVPMAFTCSFLLYAPFVICYFVYFLRSSVPGEQRGPGWGGGDTGARPKTFY